MTKRAAPPTSYLSETAKGALAIVAACTIWGLSGLYFKAIAHIPPLEVMAHRSVWSLIFLLALFAMRSRISDLRQLLRDGSQMWRIAISAVLIAINWLVYIIAVQTGHATEASLGYYIFPLVAVTLGALVFNESLSKVQYGAVALAALAVLVLGIGLGTPPWIALILSCTFGGYGIIKKTVSAGADLTVAAELVLLVPPSLAYLVWLHVQGSAAFGDTAYDSAMLVGLALFTGLPLVFLSYGFQRLSYSTLGLIQYLNPTLQLCVALIFLGETLTPAHSIALPLIWIGLALYSWDLWRQDKSARKRGIKSDTSGDTSNESAKL